MKKDFEEEILKIESTKISFDHTFRVPSLIKVEGTAQFGALILVMNEKGQIVRYALTRSTSLKECKVMMAGVREKNTIKRAITDNCCHDRQIIEIMFGPDIETKQQTNDRFLKES